MTGRGKVFGLNRLRICPRTWANRAARESCLGPHLNPGSVAKAMHKHFKITRDRIRQFVAHDLRERLISATHPVAAQFLKGDFPDENTARAAGGWQEMAKGFHWGPAYQEGWYRVHGPVDLPEGTTPVLIYGDDQLVWEAWGEVEGTIWRHNTQVGGLDFGHQFFRLDSGEKNVDLVIQTYAHNRETTVHRPEKPRTPEPEEFKGFLIGALDEERLALYYDCEFTESLIDAYPEESPLVATLMRAMNEVCNMVDPDRPATFAAARRRIKQAWDSLPDRLKHRVTPLGHAHLDTAWLWPLSVTKLKMAHTTAVQLDLIERYPEHIYVHSQASQYEWIESAHPTLFKRVQEATRKGQWEPVGSMYVEADCNLTGAESLVRQFLYGRRYFREKLGVETVDMWLPDVFGYSAALPQILSKFGIKYFLTQKMSWNQTNKIPHNTFWWKGIDGSSVWTHFPPADTYCASGMPKEIVESVNKHRDKARSDASIYLYGFGDGGGGPTETHIERLRRARTAPGMPQVDSKVSARDWFTRTLAEGQDLQTWSGELYFEFHRGTYTSQAANKRGNRRAEFLMRDAETLCCFRDDFETGYPAEELQRLWKIVLLNQFHDIIPGSSVREVYEESDRDYAEIQAKGTAIVEDSLRRIASKLDTAGFQRPIALFHQAELPSQVEIPWDDSAAPQSVACSGEVLPVQRVEDFDGPKIIFATPTAALGAVAVADLQESSAPQRPRLKASARSLENDEISVKFDRNGNITSIQTLDDDPVEFIEAGKLGNLFQLLDDKPLFWDAWETEIYAQETAEDLVKAESFEVVEKGPVRVAVERTIRFGKSSIRQRISLGPTPGIRFDCEVDWQEDHKFLKVAFPFNVNTARGTFEIQFGSVERATHRNTSWDLARFEVCAQKFADLSEGGHGAAIINQGKYGYDVHNNVLRLSLLRAPKAPDPICDRGVHRFSYVVLPHYDQIQHSDVVAASYAFNAEPRAVMIEASSGEPIELPPFVRLDTRSLVVESVKRAEDSAHRVVRLYECHNTRGNATLAAAVPVNKAWLCDLEENNLEELEVVDGVVRFGYKPYEILTVKLEL